MREKYLVDKNLYFWGKKNRTQNEQLLDSINNFHCYGRKKLYLNEKVIE